MSSNTRFFDDFILGNDLFDQQMETCAFLESQSNQLNPKFTNFVQVTTHGDSQSHTQSYDTLHPYQDSSNPIESNDLLEPIRHQPQITQTPPLALEGSLEKVSYLPNGDNYKYNVQMKGGIGTGGWWQKANGRRQWSKDEDKLLVRLVEKYGEKNWARIAEKFPMTIGKQCRDGWHNCLRPNITKNAWSEKEDMLLIKLHKQYGNRWTDIAKNMPGMSENRIKNHWNATKRRNFSSKNHHNVTNKYRPSLLKDYITSLTSSLPEINIQEKPPVSGIPTSHIVQPESQDPQTYQSFSGSGVGNKTDELVVNTADFDLDFDFDFNFDFDEVSSPLNMEMDYTEVFNGSSLDDIWLSD